MSKTQVEGYSTGKPYLGPATNKCIKKPFTTFETTETLNIDWMFDDDDDDNNNNP